MMCPPATVRGISAAVWRLRQGSRVDEASRSDSITVRVKAVGIRHRRWLHIGGLWGSRPADGCIPADPGGATGIRSMRLCPCWGRHGISRRSAGTALGGGLLLPESLQLRSRKRCMGLQGDGPSSGGVLRGLGTPGVMASVCSVITRWEPGLHLPPPRFGELLLGLRDHS